jgi:hypothetical protein
MLERTQSDKVKKVLSVPLGRTLMIRISRSSRIVDCVWSVEKLILWLVAHRIVHLWWSGHCGLKLVPIAGVIARPEGGSAQ